jgi:ATP-dependent Clp protease ATP-binding subunit ClpB
MMKQFLYNNKPAFQDLEERANSNCIRFRGLELPPGCKPSHASIGFEITSDPPAARLFVERGIHYNGSNLAIRQWLRDGVMQFPDFTSLRAWIFGPLNKAFNGQSAAGITDLAVVREGICDINHPLFLDEGVLFNLLQKRIIGQDDALKGMAGLIVRHVARKHPTRPAVVFAVGPTGVGKTRTAEIMAQVLREYDDRNNGFQFLRLDMTEYQEAHRVSQLIGAPQGYIGHGDGSQLVDALRANPRTVVLFDEIEKAHPAILRVLMNAMDAGRLSTAASSSTGRELDCRHAVFIFTSNLDVQSILKDLEERDAFGNQLIEDEVCRRRLHAIGVAPEIIGRIGRFLVFRHLCPETRAEIVAIAIAEVAEEYGLHVSHIEPSVIVDLMHKFHTQKFGVRPERFLIDNLLGGVFANAAERGITTSITVGGPPFECRSEAPKNN